jgi:ABC-type glycerol-3-phosphate transport system permease component
MAALHPTSRSRRTDLGVPLAVSRAAWYLLCLVLAAFMLLPLLWMVTIALKGDSDILQFPPSFFPKELHLENFVLGPRQINFYQMLGNTVIVTVLATIGSVLSSMLVGYGLARIPFPGRKFWFYIFTASMFLPPIVGIIPLLRLYVLLGVDDTWVPLIVPAWLANPVFIFLARQYFSAIPYSLDEAAKIDGAGYVRTFFTVMLPITRPLWITMAILAFQATWNDYLNPLIFLTSESKFVLSLGMASFSGQFAGVSTTQYNYYMATNLLYMLPPLLLFFLAQRYFMQGLSALGTTASK